MPKKESLTATSEEKKKIHQNVSLLKKSKVFRRVYKFINSKMKNVMCLEKKKRKKLINSHWNIAMQSYIGNSRENSHPLLKILSNLGSRDSWKFERKEESKQQVVLKTGQTRGRPLLLDVWLDSKLRAMIISLRTAGARINNM